MLSFLNKIIQKKIFQSDFDAFRKAPHEDQFEVGVKIFKNIDYIFNLPKNKIKTEQDAMLQEFKKMRHVNNLLGTNSTQDPRYAYPAIMESILLSLGDEELGNKIMKDIFGWLAQIGVIKKE